MELSSIKYVIDALAYSLYAFLVGGLLLGLHRKIVARIQGRPGPPVIQYILHTIKFYFKEITFPITAGNPLYLFIALMSIMVWMSALYLGVVFNTSLLILMGLYVLQKIVEHGCGLSSGSPYGKLGGVRSVFSAAAEIPLFTVIGTIYLLTKSLIIEDIIRYQEIHGPIIFQLPFAAFAFFVLLLSKAPNSPFAIVKDKSIVSGYMTEHFGLLESLIMIADGIAWFVLLWIFIAVFIGPLLVSDPLLTLVGMVVLTFLISLLCALTPLLTPNHSVMIQIIISVLALVDLLRRIIVG
ncbi:MAG TPA: NADH-ubiquinone oxidoreductase [Methanothermococcus okinawensis]|uniref:NADH-ubiquinone oxidoreductase n=1 Tax=Methanothermococcus okinawensis TaxID=155863 RepID=A0A832ZLF2_9EURY|nr:NADH-ubiquinone oxidoreductase [Methanococcaceae archaeon]HIP84213.1 NADH-ubiquinone oxidoreductase [Methanothermococcus okinawensis]HIP91011.1 NADH-ubiquinone oxidoreductase [Methanothermococcus okinawensis]